MSMKYAVLGLLVERRGYAYDIARRFEDTVGPAFHVHYGAIYQALDALERDALIHGALRETMRSATAADAPGRASSTRRPTRASTPTRSGSAPPRASSPCAASCRSRWRSRGPSTARRCSR